MKRIEISGEIGYTVTPFDIKNQLKDAGGEDLEITIASPGGFVYDGLEIYNAIRDYKRDNPDCQILATIKGVAASMGSYLAMNPAIDLLAAEDNAVFMIHNVWGVSIGDYRDMMKTAEVFQGLTGILADAYTKKTKKKKSEIRDMMDSETWLFGAEMIDEGFVDEIVKTESIKNKSEILNETKALCKGVLQKMESSNIQTEQIAAIINERIMVAEATVADSIHPAQKKRDINQEVSDMTLAQLLADHPSAKIEYDQTMRDQFAAGRESHQQTIAGAAKYLGIDSSYGKTVHAHAVDVIEGKKSLESLETLVSAIDGFRETQASAQAQADSAGIGDTPGQEEFPPDDFEAMIKADKSVYGLEV